MKSTKQILFDSQAILKWTQKEPGYQKVKSLMIACRDHSVKGYMNQINVGEVYPVRKPRCLQRGFLTGFTIKPSVQWVSIEQRISWKTFSDYRSISFSLIVSLSGELLKLRRNMRFLLQTVLPLQPP